MLKLDGKTLVVGNVKNNHDALSLHTSLTIEGLGK